MTFYNEFSELIALRDTLREWDDRYACIVRVELRPISKHTDEDLLVEDERPRLFLETIRIEVERAVDSAQLIHSLREMADGWTIHVQQGVSEQAPPISLRLPKPWWHRLLEWWYWSTCLFLALAATVLWYALSK